MKEYFFPLIVFIFVSVYFICCTYFYGIFRGLVQKNINNFLKSGVFLHISFGNIISSLIFTFIHLLLNDFAFIYLLIFLPSLFFGYLYDKYSSLLLPVLFHSFFNINAFTAYPLNDFAVFFVEKL